MDSKAPSQTPIEAPKELPKEPPKRLVLCFDGTGNQFNANESDTNIVKIFEMLDRRTSDQYHYYQPGIGTFVEGNITNSTKNGWFANAKTWVSETTDMMFGHTFVNHVIGGYQFLLKYYAPGDKIYIFGFSRGAYTARFLSEMIDNIGLLSRGNDEMIRFAWDTFSDFQRYGGSTDDEIPSSSMDNDEDAYDSSADQTNEEIAEAKKKQREIRRQEMVKRRKEARDARLKKNAEAAAKKSTKKNLNGTQESSSNPTSPDVSHLDDPASLYNSHGAGRLTGKPKNKKEAKEYMEIFRSTFCRAGVRVYFLGLFDCVNSVAAFDVHKNATPYLPRAPARHIRHALSIHERRANFKPSLFLLQPTKLEELDENLKTLEEVWFAGNHGDCGGGWELEKYKDEESQYLVSDIALKWMVAQVRNVDDGHKSQLIWHEPKVKWLNEHVDRQIASWHMSKHHKEHNPDKLALIKQGIHDPLAYNGGLSMNQILGYRFLEFLPLYHWILTDNWQKMDYEDRWVPKRWPPNYGAPRDIPTGAKFHDTVRILLDHEILERMPGVGSQKLSGWFVRYLRYTVWREMSNPKVSDRKEVKWVADPQDPKFGKHHKVDIVST